ncbi:uncharacterized protein LOC136042062 isoform X3 [Artemia franciscana]|uniref:uncharacterized protein LOC136042062 isoform X3 n=1 Tax=Artemia franciscana TaxID=6661 RepID=UPI0032DA4DAD
MINNFLNYYRSIINYLRHHKISKCNVKCRSNACQLVVLDEVNYQRHSVVKLEVRQLIINFYTMFLHAGVIRPVEDANINGVDMDFKVKCLSIGC